MFDLRTSGPMNETTLSDVSHGPARPVRLTVDFNEEFDTLMIRTRRGSGPWVFLLLWLIAWTVGCVLLLANCIREPSLGAFAFGLPFWAGWVAVACILVWMLFGTETLLLNRDEAQLVRHAVFPLSSRTIPRIEIQSF